MKKEQLTKDTNHLPVCQATRHTWNLTKYKIRFSTHIPSGSSCPHPHRLLLILPHVSFLIHHRYRLVLFTLILVFLFLVFNILSPLSLILLLLPQVFLLACLVGVAVCAPHPEQYATEELEEIIVSSKTSAWGSVVIEVLSVTSVWMD